MDWFTHIESRRRTAIFLILLLAFAVLAVTVLRESAALDSYWHLKMGQDWVEKGLSPFQDHYSITHYGEKISSPPFIFQLVIYGFVSLFGLSSGFKIFVLVSSLLVLGLFLFWLRLIKAPLPVFAICIFMLLVFLQLRVMVRPELLSYPLMVIAFILYERTRIEPSAKNFLSIVVLMLFWRNYHSAILGYVIFSGLFLDIAIFQLLGKASPKKWIFWGFWGSAVLFVGFLGHDFTHPILEMLKFPKEWADIIDEYHAPLKGQAGLQTLGLIPVAVFTLLGLLHQRQIGYFIVCLIFCWYALTITRMTAPGGLVVVCMFAMVLTRYDLHTMLSSTSRIRGQLMSASLLFVFLASLLTGVMVARNLIAQNRNMVGYFPDRLVEHMKEQQLHGRIFNPYSMGGYLIYHLGDNSRVFIDGRTEILYPVDHVERWREAMVSPDQMVAEIENLDIDYLVIKNQRRLLDVVRTAGVMELEYSDLRYNLFARKGASLPISGSIWSMPWCWSKYAGEALMSEKDRVHDLLPKYSPVSHFVSLASEFHLAADPGEFLDSLQDESYDEWYEDNLRFAGYRAIELGRFGLAIDWFDAVREKQFKDYMAFATANLKAGRIEEAERIIAYALNLKWTLSDTNDVEILYRIIVYIQSMKDMELIDQSYVNHVKKLAGHDGVETKIQPLTFQIFCQ